MASRGWNRYLTVSAGNLRNWKGVEKVMENLNREIDGIQERSLAGLIKASILIRNETEHGAVKVPVDLGNLRSSWFVVSANSKILRGGTRNSSEGQSARFVGPKSGELSAGHSSMLMEMQAEATHLSSANDGPFLIMGYSANYALWVHEMIGVNFKKAGAGPKWFEAAVKKQKDNIIKVIRDNAKIKR